MNAFEPIFFAIFRTTLLMSAAGTVVWLVLRRFDFNRFSRVCWFGVLLIGWLWLQVPCSIPWYEPVAEIVETPQRVREHDSRPVEMTMISQPVNAEFHEHSSRLVENFNNVEITKNDEPRSLIADIFRLALAIWCLGLLAMLARLGISSVWYWWLVKSAVPATPEEAADWHALLHERNITPSTIAMVFSEQVGPALVRTFSGYKLVVPREVWDELPTASRLGILRHELAHYERGDVWKSLFVRLLALPHWFNPLSHLAVRKFDEAAECLCDEAAYEQTVEGRAAFAEMLLTLHESVTHHVILRQAIWGRGLRIRITHLLNTEPRKEISIMKKTLILTIVALIFAVGLINVKLTAKTNNDNETKQASDQIAAMETKMPELETNIFENTKIAYQKAYDDLKGDITTGTFEQKATLLWHTTTLAFLYREKGQMDEALRMLENCKRYVPLLEKMAEKTDNPEEKEGVLEIISRTYSTFATFGMYDDAIAVAKLSPYTGQYNASEYLTNIANTMASKESFDKAVPVLDEAIAVAKNLPDLFRQETGIIDVAELYAKAGRMQKAHELVDSLSPFGQSRGLVAMAHVLIKKTKDEAAILGLLKDGEKIAEEITDKDDQASAFTKIATEYILFGKYDEGMKVFEKSAWANNTTRRDDVQMQIVCDLTERNKLDEAEAFVNKLQSPEAKGRALMYILREASIQGDVATMKRLIPITEPYLAHVEPFAHRLHDQLYLAAFKIRVGDVAEGRKMMDDLIAGPHVESLDRNDSISRAIGGLCYAGLYEEARQKAETMTNPTAKADAYNLIKNIYIQNEKPEENKKRLQHWEVKESSNNGEVS